MIGEVRKTRAVVLLVVGLDAACIGLILPVLPGLLRQMHAGSTAKAYGLLLATYAAMQFVFSPVLGVLSDRFGRRPVMLLSLAGNVVDYSVMAVAGSLGALFAARAVSGATGANLAVASTYLADSTTEEGRAKVFGHMNAAFGLGFIAGPALGGLLGSYGLRAPLLAGAALNLASLVLCSVALPVSSKAKAATMPGLGELNPLRSLLSISRLEGVAALLALFCTIEMVGQIPASLWVIYGQAQFRWSLRTVGLTLAMFGLLHALCQAFVTEPVRRRLGALQTVLFAVAVDMLAFTLFAFATRTAQVFALTPLFALASISLPALQALLANQGGEERQGELQGVIAALTAVAAMVGPVIASAAYVAVEPRWPGTIWLLAAAMYVPCLFVLVPLMRSSALKA